MTLFIYISFYPKDASLASGPCFGVDRGQGICHDRMGFMRSQGGGVRRAGTGTTQALGESVCGSVGSYVLLGPKFLSATVAFMRVLYDWFSNNDMNVKHHNLQRIIA